MPLRPTTAAARFEADCPSVAREQHCPKDRTLPSAYFGAHSGRRSGPDAARGFHLFTFAQHLTAGWACDCAKDSGSLLTKQDD